MENKGTDPTQDATPELDNLGAAIVKGACQAESKDVVIDLAQFGLRELLGGDVLKEIPVIKTVVACYKVPLAVRDQLFLRKVAGFLRAVPDFTTEEKEKFLREHLADPKKVNKLGETIILLLDRLDDMDKLQMLAKVFAALVRGKIPLEIFRRLATAIDQGAVADLNEFIRVKPVDPSQPRPRGPNKDAQILGTNLARTGLVSLPTFLGTVPIMGVSFRENDLGKIFREVMNGAEAAPA